MTSDLKIDGKKEITAQKERLLMCKERGNEEEGAVFASVVPSQLFPVLGCLEFTCSHCLSGFLQFSFQSKFITTKQHS